jgi:hypothetical protein
MALSCSMRASRSQCIHASVMRLSTTRKTAMQSVCHPSARRRHTLEEALVSSAAREVRGHQVAIDEQGVGGDLEIREGAAEPCGALPQRLV